MKTKNLMWIVVILGVITISHHNVQGQLLDRVKNRVKETAEDKVVNKAGEATEESMDRAEEGKRGSKKDKSSKAGNDKSVSTGSNEDDNKVVSKSDKSDTQALKSYSKFDFVAGEEIIFYEDFATDAIGDFPARWDTDASGEVVTVNSAPGNWFKLRNNGGFFPDGIPDLPDNFTIEFDVLLMHHGAMNPCGVKFDIGGGEIGNPLSDVFLGKTGILLDIGQHRFGASNYAEHEYGNISSMVDNTPILEHQGRPAHISIWRQKQRLRLYLNETKIFDLSRAFPVNTVLNLVRFSTVNTDVDPEEDCLVSNIRIAIGAPDMRSKLITEGRLVTQGILFDVNSHRIKPESAGTLKAIAEVLKENPSVKVAIVGHTDSDGNDEANLILSGKRSEAVKKALIEEYGIETARIETAGKGESEPIADNNTSEGKATNRRVEFVNIK